MNETPERICEALEWLCGGEWADNGIKNGKPSFACSDGDHTFSWDSEDGYCLRRGWAKRNIEEELANALAVTAPWEWVYDRADLPIGNGYVVLTYVAEHTIWFWYVKDPGGGPDIEGNGKTEDEAKALARAAYLTWMRGRFAMKGCMA